MNKEQIFRKLCSNNQIRDNYFSQLPADICMSYVDNGYVNNLLNERDMLLEFIFGEHTESIQWFLYDWKPGMEVGYDDVMTKIQNIDEYIDFMKKNEGFK